MDAVKRAVRTFGQGFVGTLALIAIPWLNQIVRVASDGGAVSVDVHAMGAIGIAAVAGGTIALISWAQNWLEDKTGKAILPK